MLLSVKVVALVFGLWVIYLSYRDLKDNWPPVDWKDWGINVAMGVGGVCAVLAAIF